MMCFCRYLLVAYKLGIRFTELCVKYNKKKDVINRVLTGDDVDIIYSSDQVV